MRMEEATAVAARLALPPKGKLSPKDTRHLPGSLYCDREAAPSGSVDFSYGADALKNEFSG